MQLKKPLNILQGYCSETGFFKSTMQKAQDAHLAY